MNLNVKFPYSELIIIWNRVNYYIMAIMINRVKCELYSITHFQYKEG